VTAEAAGAVAVIDAAFRDLDPASAGVGVA